jgi:hypothetical protein
MHVKATHHTQLPGVSLSVCLSVGTVFISLVANGDIQGSLLLLEQRAGEAIGGLFYNLNVHRSRKPIQILCSVKHRSQVFNQCVVNIVVL